MAETATTDVKADAVEVGSTPTDSSTEGTNNLTADTDGGTKVDFSEALNEDEPEAPSNEASDAGEPEGRPAKGAEQRKQQLNSEIRDLVAERNALRRDIEQQNREKYQTPTSDDLPSVEQLLDVVNPDTGDYYTRTEAQLLLLQAQRELDQQEKQMNEYNQRVFENTVALQNEAEQVLKEFPMFDANSDQYDASLAQAADRLLDKSIIHDPNTGRIIGSQISPYELYATIAGAAGAGRTQGEVAGRKAAQKMMANVDAADGALGTSSTTSSDTPFLNGIQKARRNY